MTRSSRRAILAALMLACAISASAAHAHRAQSVLTTVVWNETSHALEVVHRVHAHDAELGLQKALDESAPRDMGDPATQARLTAYIEQRFTLSENAVPIELDVVGAELEGDVIVIYREARRADAPVELDVSDQILRDVFEQQTNLVNVRLAKRTRTLLFSGRDGTKRAAGL